MLMQNPSRRLGKAVKMLLVANLCLWVYFWIGFAGASYRYKPDPLGHPAGTGYAFWGHSIAVTESGFKYPFFRVVSYVEFPSIALATLVARLFSPRLILYGFFAGISKGGWLLLAVMVLSFLQWYLVGWAGQKLWQRWFSHPAGVLNQAAASGPMPPGASTSRP
jgi:hypothetical protein